MARVTYGAMITDIKGSVGGFTFQSNKSGTIVRLKPTMSKISTPIQTLAQSGFSSFLAAWQQLTLSQQVAWNDFADLHTRSNAYGEVKVLTGANWYMSINYNRQRMGLSILDNPPTYLLPTGPTSYTIDLNSSTIEIDFDTPFQPTNTDLIIWTTPPIRGVSAIPRSAYRFTQMATGDNFSNIDLTSGWEAAHSLSWPAPGSANNYQVAVMVQSVLQSSGIASVGVFNIESYIVAISGIGFMEIGATFEVF